MREALLWWVAAQVVALCATPLCLALFRPLADRGYGLSKAFGLLLFGYIAWLLVSLHLFENGAFTLLLALVLIAAGSYQVWRRERASLLEFWRRRRGLLLLEESIFLLAYLGYLAIRARNADIAATEKFMDFSFLNAITRSHTFPPLDPWMAPDAALPHPTINYYYFGYLIQSLLLELTHVPPAMAFNFALGLLFGLAATGMFSLGYGVARDLVAERPASPRASPRGPLRGLPALPSSAGEARAQAAGAQPVAGQRQRGEASWREPAAGSSRRPPGSRRRVATWSFKAAWPYVAAGVLALYLLLVAGNFWTAMQRFNGSGLWQKDFWSGIGWNATRVVGIKQGQNDVDYTINEFPSFSFLLGDLHPHVLALPFTVLAVGLAYSWLMRPPRLYRWALLGELASPRPSDQWSVASGQVAPPPNPLSISEGEGGAHAAGAQPVAGQRQRGEARARAWARISPYAELLPGAMILGSLYFLNSWDFPAYFVLAQAAALGGAWWLRAGSASARASDEEAAEATIEEALPTGMEAALEGLAAIILCGALALGLVLPFLLTFKPPLIAGPGQLPLGLVEHRSELGKFLSFWGAQLLLLAPVVVAALVRLPTWQRSTAGSASRARATGGPAGGWAIVAPSLPFGPVLAGIGVLLAGALVKVITPPTAGGVGAFTLCLALALAAAWGAWRALEGGQADSGGRPLAFACAGICLALLLLAACEVVYIRDFYGGALQRMNTVFKLYYQAWLLFAAGGGVGVFWLLRRLWRIRNEAGGRLAFGGYAGLCALLLGATLLFPYKATLLRTDNLRNPPTFDGMDWLRRFHPEDYAAAQWLRDHGALPGNPVPIVLEASGGSYSEFARVATQTGFPTVLGWDQHERLWRGAAIEAEVAARKNDVNTIYTAATVTQARPLLEKYHVQYVVVGYLEQQQYGANLAKFDSATAPDGLTVAFRQGTTTIYKTAP